MFIDASALVSIIVGEDDAVELEGRFARAERPMTSAVAVYEATLAIARTKTLDLGSAATLIRKVLAGSRATIVPIGEAEAWAALDAFARFGKGRHPAKLNMGDCFAYACARTNGVALLFKGDDFGRTDIAAG